MKLCLCQMDVFKGYPEMNVRTAEACIRESSESGCDLVLLPEFWAVGFDLKGIDRHADSAGEGVFALMAEWAAEYRLAICGTHPRRQGDHIYNTAVYYDQNGRQLAAYDKMHLFSVMREDQYITPGDQIPACFDTGYGRMGIITCFDLRFPEMARRLALDGANLILVPAYWPEPRLDHWALLLRARAVENQLFTAGSNRARDDNGLDFGRSAVIAPDGRPLAEAGLDPDLIFTEFDLQKVQVSRESFPAFTARRNGDYGSF